jgi:type II secretory pathway pseudopilin PulG
MKQLRLQSASGFTLIELLALIRQKGDEIKT